MPRHTNQNFILLIPLPPSKVKEKKILATHRVQKSGRK